MPGSARAASPPTFCTFPQKPGASLRPSTVHVASQQSSARQVYEIFAAARGSDKPYASELFATAYGSSRGLPVSRFTGRDQVVCAQAMPT